MHRQLTHRTRCVYARRSCSHTSRATVKALHVHETRLLPSSPPTPVLLPILAVRLEWCSLVLPLFLPPPPAFFRRCSSPCVCVSRDNMRLLHVRAQAILCRDRSVCARSYFHRPHVLDGCGRRRTP